MAPRRAAIVVEQNGSELLSSANDVVFGSRAGCDILVDDSIVADRHCRISCDGGFTVRDLGSVTGTWVDGSNARLRAAIEDGSEIVIGTSRLSARVEDRDGVATLVLDLQRQAFWWKQPGKGVFDNDPDAMVRTEVDFGRFRALHVGNRLAIRAALVLVVAAAFFGFVMEPLADAGRLLPQHALVADIAAGAPDPSGSFAAFAKLRAEQGCDVCHSTGSGTPANKCLQCHTDFDEPTTWRHPYLVDGTLRALPGMGDGADAESFCTLCHRDHQGRDFLKQQTSDRLLGKCEACHGDGKTPFDAAARRALIDKAPVPPPVTRLRPLPTYRFPHDVHLQKKIDCRVCHRIDAKVTQRIEAGAGDDPGSDDFAETPFEVCASCHVPGAAATNMTAAERDSWRSEKQWPVAWHGTDEGGMYCQQCHTQATRDARTVFGPELHTVERPSFTPAQYAAEAALYVAKRRTHDKQFDDHAEQQACTTCHMRGGLAASEAPPTRTFWHALHIADGSLAPGAEQQANVSQDELQGCVSCHRDLETATALHTAEQGGYRWPAEPERQTACKQCHFEGDVQIVLHAAGGRLPPERRALAIAFPHDVHVGSKSFGRANTPLENGCFACHAFETPAGEAPFHSVPTTKPKAADCTQCHAGHDHIGGNQCQQCHPATAERSNSFLLSALVPVGTQVGGRAVPPAPMRDWPTTNRFSHVSKGHANEACEKCHADTGLEQAKALDAFAVPNEATKACRDCHLERQFHWR